ncbi:hypothetical protein CPLU01_13875 [Colletotrichum plurivorum]|uniref:Wax synthase domain-containing protein n=1 Tax=Colletotrichum plurivorum TaxID=2175906 RepID=A0A8H6JNA0_9PEZI|nr:hypothetical protein CPLU01_13875 [Colletotrichum plurivorum]
MPSDALVSFHTLKPGLLFASSAVLTVVALHFPPKLHRFFLVPTWALAAWSIAAVTDEVTPKAGVLANLDTYTVITSFLYVLILPTILLVESHSLVQGQDERAAKGCKSHGFVWPSRGTISAACRVWNNPRNLVFPRPPSPGSVPWSSLLRFALFRGLKVMSIILVDHWVVQRAQQYLLSRSDLLDFTPDQHQTIRPVLAQFVFSDSKGRYEPLTSHVLQLRAFMSVSWIWANFAAVETFQAGLSVLFVVVLHLDDPEDWPPLFGSFAEAWSVRRFWGRFWHRIATPTLTRWALLCVKGRWGKPRTALEKTTVAFGVFILSGVMHATAAWRTGQKFAGRDVWFFSANFLVIAVEIIVSWLYKRVLKGSKLHEAISTSPFLSAATRTLGFIWVFAWFFWAVPRWLYPNTLRMLIKEALIQARSSRFV